MPELSAAPAEIGVLAMAEKTVLLMRASSLYEAMPGTRLTATGGVETGEARCSAIGSSCNRFEGSKQDT